MSLLLDALKKAEKAKDDALRRERFSEGTGADDTVLQVRTRNELPDISRPLEMHSEDIPGSRSESSDNPVPDAFSTAPSVRPSQADPSQREPVAGGPASPRRREPVNSDSGVNDPQSSQRAAARQVFEAKFREPNPKLPFYITMAVLGLFTVGTIVYFWYQLRPPPPLVNTSAKAPPDEKKLEPIAQAATSAAPAQTGALLPGPQLVPGLPAQTAAPVQPSVPTSTPPTAQSGATPGVTENVGPTTAGAKAVAPPEAKGRNSGTPTNQRQRVEPQARAAPDPSQVSVNRAGPAINPKIESAWSAYNRGDLGAARSGYQDMLKEDPTNRDALLGMAAVEIRANRLDQAELYYRSVLQVNPRDPYAQSGLLSLHGMFTDTSQAESRVKTLLATDPEAQVLHFTLGNQYAQQRRWPEAQQAYFKAFSGDPENPDFAYNLAVSLDQVRQPKLALEYYRRALSLSQQRSSSFDQALARNRVQELTK